MARDNSAEVFECAYANIGLCSDNVWISGEPDYFRKTNQGLWIRYNRLDILYKNVTDKSNYSSTSIWKKFRTVRNTIPHSRLAQYGNYEYNEERESLYTPDDTLQQCEDFKSSHNFKNESNTPTEVWMLPEVKEEFKRLTCLNDSEDQNFWTDHEEETGGEKASTKFITDLLTSYPKLTSLMCNSRHHQSLFSDSSSASKPECDKPYDLSNFPASRYTINSQEERELHYRINSVEVRRIWSGVVTAPTLVSQKKEVQPCKKVMFENSSAPTQNQVNELSQRLSSQLALNVDVPEFFPKPNTPFSIISSEAEKYGRKYFPSSGGITYQNELFPYSQNFESFSYDIIAKKAGSGRSSYTNTVMLAEPIGSSIFSIPSSMGMQNLSSQLKLLGHQPPPSSSILCRPPQQWFNNALHQQKLSSLVYPNLQTSNSGSSDVFRQVTPPDLISIQTSFPKSIPVFQRPPEFYIQHRDTTNKESGTTNKRHQSGGVDRSNLILLTQRKKSHLRSENIKQQHKQKHRKHKLQVETPSSSDQSKPPLGESIFGRDLFSHLQLRNVANRSEHSGSLHTTELINDNSITGHSPVTEENVIRETSEFSELTSSTIEMLHWLDQNYPDRASELRDVGKLIDDFLSIESKLEHETETEKTQQQTNISFDRHFPPIQCVSPINTSSSPVTSELTNSPLLTATPSTLSGDRSGSPSPAVSSVKTSAKKRLYRDVLASSSLAPVTSYADNGLERRFEELERQAIEQYRMSDDNLGQSLRHLPSDERVAQKYQELEQQAMEQYEGSCSNSFECHDGCTAETSNTDKSAKGRSANTGQLPVCSGLKYCPISEDMRWGNGRKRLCPSERKDPDFPSLINKNVTLNYLWNPEVEKKSVNVNNSNAVTKKQCIQPSHSQDIISGTQPSPPPTTSGCRNNRSRHAAASKSLPAIGITTPILTISKHQAIAVGAAGDEDGAREKTRRRNSKRVLVLTTPTKKIQLPQSSSEDKDVEDKQLRPQIVVLTRERRQASCRLVATTQEFQCQESESSREHNSGTVETKTIKKRRQRSTGGTGDESAGAAGNTNPNAERTQVSEKCRSQLERRNEKDQANLPIHNNIVAGYLEVPETWVHKSSQQTSDNDQQKRQQFLHQEYHDRQEARSNGDLVYPSSNDADLDHTSSYKTLPWMKQHRKKRLTNGNKKKLNKLSIKQANFTTKQINKSDSTYFLTLNENNRYVCEVNLESSNNVGKNNMYPHKYLSDLQNSKEGKNNETQKHNNSHEPKRDNHSSNFVSNQHKHNENHSTEQKEHNENRVIECDNKEMNEFPKENKTEIDNIRNDQLQCQRRNKSQNRKSRRNKTKQHETKKHDSSMCCCKHRSRSEKRINNINTLNVNKCPSEHKIHTIKTVEERVGENIDKFIFQHLGKREFNIKLTNNSLRPVCVIPYSFDLKTQYERCVTDIMFDSKVAKHILRNCIIHVKWPEFWDSDNFDKNGFWDKNISKTNLSEVIHKLTPEILIFALDFQMKHVIKGSIIKANILEFGGSRPPCKTAQPHQGKTKTVTKISQAIPIEKEELRSKLSQLSSRVSYVKKATRKLDMERDILRKRLQKLLNKEDKLEDSLFDNSPVVLSPPDILQNTAQDKKPQRAQINALPSQIKRDNYFDNVCNMSQKSVVEHKETNLKSEVHEFDLNPDYLIEENYPDTTSKMVIESSSGDFFKEEYKGEMISSVAGEGYWKSSMNASNQSQMFSSLYVEDCFETTCSTSLQNNNYINIQFPIVGKSLPEPSKIEESAVIRTRDQTIFRTPALYINEDELKKEQSCSESIKKKAYETSCCLQ